MRKTIFIGQAMPRKKSHPHDWPTLNLWLSSLGVGEDQIKRYFFYSALVNYFPGARNGSHLVPTPQMIAEERSRLTRDIVSFGPEVVVPIGKLSIHYCLGIKEVLLTELIGKRFEADPYAMVGRKLVVVPLPHPSGASTWLQNKDHKLLLTRALTLLRESLN